MNLQVVQVASGSCGIAHPKPKKVWVNPLKCLVCGTVYCNKGNLRRHTKIKHEGTKFPCEYCSESCSTKQNLERHVQRWHASSLPLTVENQNESEAVAPVPEPRENDASNENAGEIMEVDEPIEVVQVETDKENDPAQANSHKEEENNSRTDGNVVEELFNTILLTGVPEVLPNKSWTVCCRESPLKCIVVSEISISVSSEQGLVPLNLKQIVFDDKLNYEVYIFNTKAILKNKPSPVRTLDDFARVIRFVNALQVCAGGPKVSEYINASPECAYKDNESKWRHNLCSLEISKGTSCKMCLSLKEILKKQVQSKRGKKRRK